MSTLNAFLMTLLIQIIFYNSIFYGLIIYLNWEHLGFFVDGLSLGVMIFPFMVTSLVSIFTSLFIVSITAY